MLQELNEHLYVKAESLELSAPSLMSIIYSASNYRSDDDVKLGDKVADALLETAPLKRLEGIGFLGAIDYVKKGSGRSPHRRRHNRREHSIGVAKLAETYALQVEMSERERKTLVCAALLHDVGHGPLSHTLEPVFEEKFGINHHLATREIIQGETHLGAHILETLNDFEIDPDEVIALIEGKDVGNYAFLFSGQINIDTLEAITRCRAFVGPRSAFGSANALVKRWATSSVLPQNGFDDFWSLKHSVYNLVINAPLGRLLDTVAQAYMVANIDKFCKDDFLKTEKHLKASHPELFQYLNLVLHEDEDLLTKLPKNWLAADVHINSRTFFVNTDVNLKSNCTIDDRYRQSKTQRSVTLEELIRK